MDCSELKKALNTIYAETSVDKALTGHAYSRRMKGHFLQHLALSNIIFWAIELNDVDKIYLKVVLSNLGFKNFTENMEKKK